MTNPFVAFIVSDSVHTDGQTDRRVTGLKIVLIFNFSNFQIF